MSTFRIRPLGKEDRAWVADFLDTHWGSTQIVSRGKACYGHLQPGFIAESDGDAPTQRLGLLTYRVEEKICEILTLNSAVPQQGIGTALVESLLAAAKEAAIRRVWLVTTNDNLEALRFWQKRGFALSAVYPNAISDARRLKPQIPLVGHHGIPIRDEIELELLL